MNRSVWMDVPKIILVLLVAEKKPGIPSDPPPHKIIKMVVL